MRCQRGRSKVTLRNAHVIDRSIVDLLETKEFHESTGSGNASRGIDQLVCASKVWWLQRREFNEQTVSDMFDHGQYSHAIRLFSALLIGASGSVGQVAIQVKSTALFQRRPVSASSNH